MNVKRCTPKAWCWMVGVSALFVGSGLQFGSAFAQDVGKTNRVGNTAGSDFQVFQLKNCPATEMADTLSRVFNLNDASAIRIVPDARANAILVSAPDGDMAKIKDLVAKLDVLAREDGSDTTETLVITLKYSR